MQALALIIPSICIAFAGFFKSVADTLAHHYDTSVFRRMDKRFWDPSVSWQHVGFLPLTKYRADAWHLANTLQIVSWCAAIAFAPPLSWWQIILGAGALFNLVFNLCYNKILKK